MPVELVVECLSLTLVTGSKGCQSKLTVEILGRKNWVWGGCGFWGCCEGFSTGGNCFMPSIMDKVKNRIENMPEREGPVGRAVENYSAKVPSDIFFWAAAGSVLASLALKASKRNHEALFVGQWAPTFLVLGLFNKLVRSYRHAE
jgi:hypothetical protein